MSLVVMSSMVAPLQQRAEIGWVGCSQVQSGTMHLGRPGVTALASSLYLAAFSRPTDFLYLRKIQARQMSELLAIVPIFSTESVGRLLPIREEGISPHAWSETPCTGLTHERSRSSCSLARWQHWRLRPRAAPRGS